MKSRRDFLKTSGMLVVSVGAARAAMFAGPLGAAAQAAGPYPDPDFRQLDSWIVMHGDNTATFYVGKTDCGQGTGTAFRQMMSDELDIAYDKTTCVMGSTDNTVDQGGSGGSDAIQTDGWPMRRVAAEARRVLLDMASARFGVPVDALAVSAGVITVKADSATPPRRVTYGELIGGKKFHVALTGSNIDATTGIAAVKPVQELKIVGQSPQRYDIPAKVDGSMKWAVGVNLPGMVHARNVKPPVAGAKLVSVDESSVRQPPGLHQGRQQRQLRRRRLRARRAGRQRGATAQGELGEAVGSAVPVLRGSAQLHARRHAHVQLETDGRRRSGRGVFRSGQDRRGRVRHPVPGAHRVRPGARHRGSVERADDDLLERHEVLRHAQRRGDVSRHAARSRARRSGWKARRDTAVPRRTTRGSRRRSSRGRSAGPYACSGCGTKKRRGTRRRRRLRARFEGRSTPRAISSATTTSRAPPTTTISATTSPIPCSSRS